MELLTYQTSIMTSAYVVVLGIAISVTGKSQSTTFSFHFLFHLHFNLVIHSVFFDHVKYNLYDKVSLHFTALPLLPLS